MKEETNGYIFPYLLDAYFELCPNYIEDSDLHFFMDEIHEVLGWEKFVRGILDKEKIQLYITGSSAKQLSKEIASLRRETEEIYYYQTDSGKEVDFLVKNPSGEVKLYQVFLSLREQKTIEREVSALTGSMKTLNLSSGVIVTLEEENHLEIAEGSIEVMPAWKFL